MITLMRLVFSNPESLSQAGNAAVIIGLIGDIIILFIPTKLKLLEKLAAIFFILVIIVGVKMEGIADQWKNEPRLVTAKLADDISKKVLPLLRVDRPPSMGIDPLTPANIDLANQLFPLLKGAHANEGAAQFQVGPVRGVVAAYVTLNERGKKFAEAFAQALNDNGIEAKAVPGLMEPVFHTPTPAGGKGLDPTEPGHSWVITVVGDKP
jgi:hypothetical protein